MAHRLTAQARNASKEIWDYIFGETGSDTGADRTLDMIVERFSLLAQWPRLGRTRDDLRRGLRSYPAGNYLIFYRIDRASIVILRAIHGRRDIVSLFP